MVNQSIPQVIPFGDTTVDDIAGTAEDLGVSPGAVFDMQQQARDAQEGPRGLRRNPGRPRPQQPPGGKSSVSLKADVLSKDDMARLGNSLLPPDVLAGGAAVAATAADLARVRRSLMKVAHGIRDRLAEMTEDEWNLYEDWRMFALDDRAWKAGREPDPSKMKRRPYADRHKEYLTRAWYRGCVKLSQWLADTTRQPPFQVFTKGSIKLPFYQWSTLPGATCPGAGLCWDDRPQKPKLDADGDPYRPQHSVPGEGRYGYCYSLTAWRNAGSYLRQLQNTILTRLDDKTHIERALKKIADESDVQVSKGGPRQVVRLFVDGDFDSLKTLEYWMHACERHPGLVFYGYSKSWKLFTEWDAKHGGKWPTNYALNLSGGSVFEKMGPEIEAAWIRRMSALSCVRGRFVAIKGVPSSMPAMTEKEAKDGVDPRTKEGFAEHMRDVVRTAREKYGITGPILPCPGKCYACGSSKSNGSDVTQREFVYGDHYCGRRSGPVVGMSIVIAVH